MNEMLCPNWACHKRDAFKPFMDGPETYREAVTNEKAERWTCDHCDTVVVLYGDWTGKHRNHDER